MDLFQDPKSVVAVLLRWSHIIFAIIWLGHLFFFNLVNVPLQADLEDGSPWPLPGRRFGAVIVTNYLHRPLMPALLEALTPGGVLLYETFMVGNERFGKPSNPDFLLKDGELLEMVRGKFSVVAYEARMVSEPKIAMVQRIAARRL